MSFESAIATLLEADAGAGGVNTLLTGGIYTWTETGRNGLSRTNSVTAGAWQTGTPLLRPCAIVKDRAEVPDGGIMDDATPAVSYRQVVEIWLYDAGSSTTTTLETVKSRIFVLLHGQRVSNRLCRWVGSPVIDERVMALEQARIVRCDYQIVDVKRSS